MARAEAGPGRKAASGGREWTNGRTETGRQPPRARLPEGRGATYADLLQRIGA